MTTPEAHRSRWRLRDERSLFLLGTGLVALHVVDDRFLQPPAGTSAADHLVSGLVPIALLVAAAWGHGRVRAGSRGLLALVVGVFGVGIGALEAGYYATAVGPSGDDFSGLVAIPAGLLLVGVGAVVLWRSRRRDGSMRRRVTRRALLVVAAALASFFVAQPVLFAYAVTHLQRAEVPAEALGIAHEEVSFTTSDGLRLRGWYIPSRNGAAVVDFPGRLGTQAAARMLARHGYGVLLFDRRGEGSSEGGGNLLGWGGDKDIIAAVDWLEKRPDVDPRRIGGIGFSVGGELMLEAAAKDPDLSAVVSDGAGARQLWEDKQALAGRDFWPMSPGFALLTGAVAVFSDTAPPATLTDLVPRIAPRPLLLIWAPDGGNATEVLTPEYHRVAGPNASLWAIPHAKHIKGIEAQPRAYEHRVVAFFDDALLGR
ncbi:MAG: alpha/beta hydrolase [Actinomycetes bacterium]